MKVKFNLRRELKIAAAIVVVLVVIAFTEHKQSEFAIHDISVRITNTNNNHFLDEAATYSALSSLYPTYLAARRGS